jgi:hypothetical protein
MISRTPLAAAGAVVFLLLVVALTSRGHLTGGEGDTRQAPVAFWDYVVTTSVVLIFFAIAGIAYIVWSERGQMKLPPRVNDLRKTLVTFLAICVLMAVIADRGRIREGPRVQEDEIGERAFGFGTTTQAVTTGRDEAARDPQFKWPVAAVVAGIVGGALAALLLAGRRRERIDWSSSPAVGESLADVLEDALDALRAEQDPRRAVIAAYANMERTLRAYGLPRRPAEAPFEYLERVLLALRATAPAVRRLTDLFERAKFSNHRIGPELKEEAIQTLGAIRDELREPAVEEEAA